MCLSIDVVVMPDGIIESSCHVVVEISQKIKKQKNKNNNDMTSLECSVVFILGTQKNKFLPLLIVIKQRQDRMKRRGSWGQVLLQALEIGKKVVKNASRQTLHL